MTDCNRTGPFFIFFTAASAAPPLALIHPPLMSTLSEVAPGGWVALRLMATGLAGRTHLSAQKNVKAQDERGVEVQRRTTGEGVRERREARRGHASGTHQCSPHMGQFIRIIKLCLTLKVKITINLTWIQKKRDKGAQATKTSSLLCVYYVCLLYCLGRAIYKHSTDLVCI